MNCNQIRASIENGFSEPLDPHTQRIVDAHVIDCSDCRAFATETKNVISFASRPTVPEQSGEYWDSYYDRLVEKMELPAAAGSAPVSSSPTWSTWLQHLLPQSRPAIQFALIAAVLVIGILIGRVLSNNNGSLPPQQVAGSAEDGEPGVHLTSLDDRTDRFLDRSKVILLGMVNMDLTETGADDVDLSQTRLVAHELVKESGPLRGELEEADQQRLMTLIDDLEVILLQIANLEEDADIPAIEMVKDGVDQRAVLLKINVSEMRSTQRGDGS